MTVTVRHMPKTKTVHTAITILEKFLALKIDYCYLQVSSALFI